MLVYTTRFWNYLHQVRSNVSVYDTFLELPSSGTLKCQCIRHVSGITFIRYAQMLVYTTRFWNYLHQVRSNVSVYDTFLELPSSGTLKCQCIRHVSGITFIRYAQMLVYTTRFWNYLHQVCSNVSVYDTFLELPSSGTLKCQCIRHVSGITFIRYAQMLVYTTRFWNYLHQVRSNVSVYDTFLELPSSGTLKCQCIRHVSGITFIRYAQMLVYTTRFWNYLHQVRSNVSVYDTFLELPSSGTLKCQCIRHVSGITFIRYAQMLVYTTRFWNYLHQVRSNVSVYDTFLELPSSGTLKCQCIRHVSGITFIRYAQMLVYTTRFWNYLHQVRSNVSVYDTFLELPSSGTLKCQCIRHVSGITFIRYAQMLVYTTRFWNYLHQVRSNVSVYDTFLELPSSGTLKCQCIRHVSGITFIRYAQMLVYTTRFWNYLHQVRSNVSVHDTFLELPSSGMLKCQCIRHVSGITFIRYAQMLVYTTRFWNYLHQVRSNVSVYDTFLELPSSGTLKCQCIRHVSGITFIRYAQMLVYTTRFWNYLHQVRSNVSVYDTFLELPSSGTLKCQCIRHVSGITFIRYAQMLVYTTRFWNYLHQVRSNVSVYDTFLELPSSGTLKCQCIRHVSGITFIRYAQMLVYTTRFWNYLHQVRSNVSVYDTFLELPSSGTLKCQCIRHVSGITFIRYAQMLVYTTRFWNYLHQVRSNVSVYDTFLELPSSGMLKCQCTRHVSGITFIRYAQMLVYTTRFWNYLHQVRSNVSVHDTFLELPSSGTLKCQCIRHVSGITFIRYAQMLVYTTRFWNYLHQVRSNVSVYDTFLELPSSGTLKCQCTRHVSGITFIRYAQMLVYTTRFWNYLHQVRSNVSVHDTFLELPSSGTLKCQCTRHVSGITFIRYAQMLVYTTRFWNYLHQVRSNVSVHDTFLELPSSGTLKCQCTRHVSGITFIRYAQMLVYTTRFWNYLHQVRSNVSVHDTFLELPSSGTLKCQCTRHVSGITFIRYAQMLVYTTRFWNYLHQVRSNVSAHDTFLELPSSGTLKCQCTRHVSGITFIRYAQMLVYTTRFWNYLHQVRSNVSVYDTFLELPSSGTLKCQCTRHVSGITFIRYAQMLVYTTRFWNYLHQVRSNVSVHDTFLELPSSGMLKCQCTRHVSGITFIRYAQMLVHTTRFWNYLHQVCSNVSVHDTFLELPSSGTLKCQCTRHVSGITFIRYAQMLVYTTRFWNYLHQVRSNVSVYDTFLELPSSGTLKCQCTRHVSGITFIRYAQMLVYTTRFWNYLHQVCSNVSVHDTFLELPSSGMLKCQCIRHVSGITFIRYAQMLVYTTRFWNYLHQVCSNVSVYDTFLELPSSGMLKCQCTRHVSGITFIRYAQMLVYTTRFWNYLHQVCSNVSVYDTFLELPSSGMLKCQCIRHVSGITFIRYAQMLVYTTRFWNYLHQVCSNVSVHDTFLELPSSGMLKCQCIRHVSGITFIRYAQMLVYTTRFWNYLHQVCSNVSVYDTFLELPSSGMLKCQCMRHVSGITFIRYAQMLVYTTRFWNYLHQVCSNVSVYDTFLELPSSGMLKCQCIRHVSGITFIRYAQMLVYTTRFWNYLHQVRSNVSVHDTFLELPSSGTLKCQCIRHVSGITFIRYAQMLVYTTRFWNYLHQVRSNVSVYDTFLELPSSGMLKCQCIRHVSGITFIRYAQMLVYTTRFWNYLHQVRSNVSVYDTFLELPSSGTLKCQCIRHVSGITFIRYAQMLVYTTRFWNYLHQVRSNVSVHDTFLELPSSGMLKCQCIRHVSGITFIRYAQMLVYTTRFWNYLHQVCSNVSVYDTFLELPSSGTLKCQCIRHVSGITFIRYAQMLVYTTRFWNYLHQVRSNVSVYDTFLELPSSGTLKCQCTRHVSGITFIRYAQMLVYTTRFWNYLHQVRSNVSVYDTFLELPSSGTLKCQCIRHVSGITFIRYAQMLVYTTRFWNYLHQVRSNVSVHDTFLELPSSGMLKCQCIRHVSGITFIRYAQMLVYTTRFWNYLHQVCSNVSVYDTFLELPSSGTLKCQCIRHVSGITFIRYAQMLVYTTRFWNYLHQVRSNVSVYDTFLELPSSGTLKCQCTRHVSGITFIRYAQMLVYTTRFWNYLHQVCSNVSVYDTFLELPSSGTLKCQCIRHVSGITFIRYAQMLVYATRFWNYLHQVCSNVSVHDTFLELPSSGTLKCQCIRHVSGITFIRYAQMLVYTTRFWNYLHQVRSNVSVYDTFLELPSSGTLKSEILESQISI